MPVRIDGSLLGLPEQEPNKQVRAIFWNEPLNPLEQSIDKGLRNVLSSNALVQEDKHHLASDTNLVITHALYGRDIPITEMAVFRLPRNVEKYNAKVLGIISVPRIPDFAEMDPTFLETILDQPPGTDRDLLIALAKKRLHSPALTIGYPEMAMLGCNLILLLEGEANATEPLSAHLIGLEQSHPQIPIDANFFRNLYRTIEPQILSTLVIKNQVRNDVIVPEHIFAGSPLPKQLIAKSREMHELGLYPPPFPLKRVVSRVKQTLYDHLLGISGLSFGNTSARATGELSRYGKFIMSQSGVSKDQLTAEQVLIALGVHPTKPMMQIAAREGVRYGDSTRISVDAIEVEQIYDEFPDVNVTAHGHVWLINPQTHQLFQPTSRAIPFVDGTFVVFTDEQYPCGSVDLGKAAGRSLRSSPNPARTYVLEKRHGLVALGDNYDEMFERLRELRDSELISSSVPQDLNRLA